MQPSATSLSNREVAAVFDRAAADYDDRCNAYAMQRRAAALAAHACGLSVEVGGGTGAVCSRVQGHGRAIHSDIAPGMCSVAARRLGRPSVCFDAECIPFADEAVDSLLSAEMIYYLQRPTLFLREAFRVVRPGGRLILSSTNSKMAFLDRLRSVLRRVGLRRMFFDDGSPSFPSREALETAVREAGFVIETVCCIVPLPFRICDPLNRLLERSPLGRFGLFMIVSARKP
jgi:malonyl-CoA O-methyltransferase